MTCPYSEPNCAPPVAANGTRCGCERFLKRCSRCGAANRSFANFCRSCGAAATASGTNWLGYRGGPRRLGLNSAKLDSDGMTEPVALKLALGDACRSLLGYDGHLVAVSLNGLVEVADLPRARSICRFQTQGPVTAEPCIAGGILYLATPGKLSAYSLAALTLRSPRMRPLWQLPLNGTPIQALTPAGDRLYVTVASADWRELHAIAIAGRHVPSSVQLIHGAPRLSWVAADPERAVFFSEGGGRGLQLHVGRQELVTHPVSLPSFAEHPVALLGGKIFGIFGDVRRLYRIDAATGAVEEPLDEDMQLFALSYDGGDEWDRDGVYVDTTGIGFVRSGVRDSFEPYDRAAKGSPIIVQGSAVVVGMEDGRVRIYNAAQLPRHDLWVPGGKSGAAITALASFDCYVAAGNRDGIVEVRRFRARGIA